MPDLRDPIIRRIQDLAIQANEDPNEAVELAEFGRHPEWRLDTRYIEFQCGCVAKRYRTLFGAKPSDPVIFRGLPEQAVYDKPCEAHSAGINSFVRFGGFVDFSQWKASRYRTITGETL